MSKDSIIKQDAAAGGSHKRYIVIHDGSVVRATVAVRQFSSTPHQQYAYLQFKHYGKTITKYIGRVTSNTKEEALLKGWKLLIERGLVEDIGWSWYESKIKDE
jgi:hypothetical protein